MKSEEFNKCREFLEKQIIANPDNNEFLNVYLKLIELKSEHDLQTEKAVLEKEIRHAEIDERFQSNLNTNQTNLNISNNANWAAVQQTNSNNWAATQQTYSNNWAHTQQNLNNNQLNFATNLVNRGLLDNQY